MRSPALEGQRAQEERYILDDQVGFLLRQAQQRHTTIFAAEMIESLTPTQWAALAKLWEVGDCSQNHLGRLTAMDAATIKGVIDRLNARGFTTVRPDPRDGRRIVVALTPMGSDLYDRAAPIAARITEKTLEPLSEDERSTLVALLRRLA
jgi:MarR family transcriptional regulator, lower aerobic nicotinate degradation pathway regulator